MTTTAGPQNLKIGGLKIERLIAQGGMAEVYLAEQNSLGRKVAVKVLDPRGSDAEFANRFFQEARLVASLNHPNIITIYDFGTLEDGRLFLSMEYLPGGDLETQLEKGISEESSVRILGELTRALTFIHKKEILHRDIKPANILFRQDGSLVLTDFGIAKAVDKKASTRKVTVTQAGTTMGSPAYSSPEQAQGHPLDQRTDIYSVGVMLLEMLTGSNPYKSDTNINTVIKHIQMPIPALQGRLARYQPMINKMLAKNPRDRFNSMLEVQAFIDKLTGSFIDNAVVEQPAAPADTGLLKQCAEDSKLFFADVLQNFHESINKKLDDLLETSRSNVQQWQLLEVSRNLRKKRDDLNREFQNSLNISFQDLPLGKYKSDQTLSTKAVDPGALSLVANDELERNIAASTLVKNVEDKYAEELCVLHERLCSIAGKTLPLEACPVGPYQLAQNFKKAIQQMQLEKQITILFFKILEKNLLAQLGPYYKELNKKLAEAGVLPKLTFAEIQKRNIAPANMSQRFSESGLDQLIEQEINQLDSGNRVPAQPMQNPSHTQAAPIMPDADLPSGVYQQQLMGAIRQMQQMSFVAPPGGGFTTAVNDAQAYMPASEQGEWSQMQGAGFVSAPVYSRSDIVTALNGLQGRQVQAGNMRGSSGFSNAVANAVVNFQEMQPGNVKPCPLQPLDAVMDAIAQVSPDDGDEPKQLKADDSSAIDLVGMIFEYLLQDEQLPDSVKALLSYLQIPYIKVALLDPEMFARVDHPARILLDKLSEAGSKWLNKEGYGQFKIFDEIKSVVYRVIHEFDEGIELFDQLVAEFDSFVNKVQRRVDQLEKLAAQKAEAEQHLQKVKAYVHKRIKTRVTDEHLPVPIVAFLLYPWFDYLTSIMLRYGEKSEQWQQGLQVVDNLLWSIKPKETQYEETRLNNLRDVLSKQIQKGFDTVGYDPIKAQDILLKISELQDHVLKNKNQPIKVTEKERTEIHQMVKEASVREKIVQAPVASEMTEDEQELVDKLRLIEFGTWFEFRELEKSEAQKLKVAWFNSDNLSYLMVNSAGKQVSMMTALEIARQMIARTACIIAGSAKPFFERALEAIYKKMAASMPAAA